MIEPDAIYIPETTILYNLFTNREGFNSPSWKGAGNARRKAERLFQNKRIVLPMAVLSEFIGGFFHQYIDLKNYDSWYRKRRICLDQFIINPVFSHGNVNLEYGSMKAERIAFEIGYADFPKNLVRKLQRYHSEVIEKKKRMNEKPPSRIPKLFDGNDALILGEVFSIALNQPDVQHYFVTADLWMLIGFGAAKHKSGYSKELTNLHPLPASELHKHLKS